MCTPALCGIFITPDSILHTRREDSMAKRRACFFKVVCMEFRSKHTLVHGTTSMSMSVACVCTVMVQHCQDKERQSQFDPNNLSGLQRGVYVKHMPVCCNDVCLLQHARLVLTSVLCACSQRSITKTESFQA